MEEMEVGCGFFAVDFGSTAMINSPSRVDGGGQRPLHERSRKHRQAVLSYLRERRRPDDVRRLICIGGECDENDEELAADRADYFWTLSDFFIYFHYGLCNEQLGLSRKMDGAQAVKFNERTSLLSVDDEMAVVQLCLAELNRKVNGVFDVDLDQVVPAKDRIARMRLKSVTNGRDMDELGLSMVDSRQPMSDDFDSYDQLVIDYELYLSRCNVVDSLQLLSSKPASFLMNYDLVIFHLPVDPVEKIMLQLLLAKKPTFTVSSTVAFEESFTDETSEIDFEFKTEKCALLDVLISEVPKKLVEASVAAELYMEKVIVAYLRLLLNTRDEIALTIVLGSMVNGFSHEAFTALKKLSKSSGSLSMYQTALSFVLKLKLGGQSYAPNSSCPVMQYLPEILTFTTVMNKLQTAVEEEADSLSAFKKIFTVLKLHLTKTCNAKLKIGSLQMALQNVEKMALRAIKITKHSQVAEKNITELQHLVNLHAAKVSFQSRSTEVWTLDISSSQNSPIRFPSLLSQFKSPVETVPPNYKLKDTNCKGTVNSKLKDIVNCRSKDAKYVACQKCSPVSNNCRPRDSVKNKENTTPVQRSNSKVRPTKRCLTEALVDPAVEVKKVRRPNDTASGSSRAPSKKSSAKPVAKGQQLMTRFLMR